MTSTSSNVGRLVGYYAAILLAGAWHRRLGAKFALTQPASSEGGSRHEGEP